MAYRLSTLWKENAHIGSAWAVAYEEQSQKIVTGDANGNLKVWGKNEEEEDLEEQLMVKGHHILGISKIILRKDNDDLLILSSGMDGTLKKCIYNIKTNKIKNTESVTLALGKSVDVAATDEHIAVSGENGIIWIYDYNLKQQRQLYTDPQDESKNQKKKVPTILTSAYHESQELFACGYHTGEVAVFETKHYSRVALYKGYTGSAVRDLCFMDEYIFAVYDDGYLRIFTKEHPLVATMHTETGMTAVDVLCVHYESENAAERTFFIATGHLDGSVKIFEFSSKGDIEALHSFIEHKKRVWALEFEQHTCKQPLDATIVKKSDDRLLQSNYVHLFSVASDGNLRSYLCPLDQSK